eukprot:GHVR01035455.1.p2 GENE.GHVR01035455.1~~GHVR01035455.1.p2  ORF type:complete len:659 (-),score=76.57 GHVR01035455.1:2159-4135(-)
MEAGSAWILEFSPEKGLWMSPIRVALGRISSAKAGVIENTFGTNYELVPGAGGRAPEREMSASGGTSGRNEVPAKESDTPIRTHTDEVKEPAKESDTPIRTHTDQVKEQNDSSGDNDGWIVQAEDSDEDPAMQDTIQIMSAPGGATHSDVKPGEEELFEDAMSKELRSFVDNDVLRPVTHEEMRGVKPLPAGWRLTWKAAENTRKQKARLCVQGFRDRRGDLETYSGTPSTSTQRLAHVIGHTKGWQLAYTDVCTAFLQAPMINTQPLFVQLPELMPSKPKCHGLSAGGIYKVNKTIYGLCDAPKAFKAALTDAKLNFHAIPSEDSLYLKKENEVLIAMVLAYVDDLKCWSDDPVNDLKEIGQLIKCDSPTLVKRGTTHKLIGITVTEEDTYTCFSIGNYLKPMLETNSFEGMKRSGKLSPNDFSEETSEPVNEDLIPEYRSLIGKLAWTSKMVPEVSFAFSELAKYSTKPTSSLLRSLKTVLYQAATSNSSITLTSLEPSDAVLRIWTDASYNIRSHTGKSGYLVQLLSPDTPTHTQSNILGWQSKSIKRKLSSTTSAELVALRDGLKTAVTLLNLLKQLTLEVKVVFCVDSAPLLSQLQSGKSPGEFGLQGMLDYVREQMNLMNAEAVKVDSTNMKADMLTKSMLRKGLLVRGLCQ